MAVDIEWVRENPKEAARQIDLLSEECEQYRAAEEMQIALREKSYDERDALAAHVEEVQRLAADWVENEQTLAATWQLARKVGKWSFASPAESLARRDALKQAEALEEAAGETVPAMHKMANWLIGRAAEKRRQAEGGA